MKLKTEDKAIRVISSCKTQEQLHNATKYASFYFKKHGDTLFYTHLLTIIKAKNSELSNA